MSEEDRERIYLRIALAVLVVSPWNVAGLMAAGIAPAWDQTRFLLVLFAAVPATFLLELLITLLKGQGPTLRFWVKHPSVRCQHEAKGGVEGCEREVRARLEKMSFTWESLAPGKARFQKPKAPQVHAFLDNTFSGEVTFGATGFGTTITVDLTFVDILLLETGERSKLTALGDFICLRTTDDAIRGVPLLIYCGVTLSFVTALVSAAVRLWPKAASPWLFPSSAAVVGLLAFAMWYVRRDRRQLFGYRLAAVALVPATVPWLAWLLRLAQLFH